jgi:hypothetical protein
VARVLDEATLAGEALLERTQRGACEEVAAERGEQQHERAADEERRAQAAQRLGAVLARRAHDQHAPTADGKREQPRRLVETGDGRPVCPDDRMAHAHQLRRGEQRRPDRRRRIEHAPARVEHLAERLALLDQRPLRRAQRAAVADERRDVLRARAELLVERAGQVGRDPLVHEPAGRQQHDGHRAREDERQPPADRQARHLSPSRRRYPTPRTVSSESVPNGRSIFSRRYRT